MKIKLYEKFVKDNNLIIGYNSAKEFIDLIDEPNYDNELLSEEYIEYATTLATKKAKINNLIKACKICPDNMVSRILLLDSAKNQRNNMVDLSIIKDVNFKMPYKENKVLFSDYVVDELNYKYKELIEKDIYHPESDNDMFLLGYEAKQYLWSIKKLYVNFIEQWDIDNASRVGERLLALNPNDDFNILDSLPYLYLYLESYDDAKICAGNRSMDSTERYLVNAFLDVIDSNEEKAVEELIELNKLNPFVIKMIATSYNPKNLTQLVHEDNDYSFASYLYVNLMLAGDKMDLLKKAIIKNYKEFE